MPPKRNAKKTVAEKKVPAKIVLKKPVKKPVERVPKSAVKKEETPGEVKIGEETKEAPAERYWEAVGRRKTAVARVRLFTRGDKVILVNGKPLVEYFPYPRHQRVASEAVETMKSSDRFRVTSKVKGGGKNSQAEAIRHATSRALVLFNSDFRKRLKRAGFLRRDPRMKERKKFGLKGARRAPQWSKR